MERYVAEKVEIGLKMRLGEGPVWQADTNTLSWVDILSGTLHILQGDRVLSIETGQYIGAAVPVASDGQYLAALTTGFYLMDKTGLIDKIGSPLDMPLRCRFNDAKCDRKGRLFAGIIGLYGDEGKKGRLYCLENGAISTVLEGMVLPNGMAWDDDRGLFYMIDTPTGTVEAYEYDGESAHVSHSHTAAVIEEGVPDGMTLDAEGNLWVAQWGGGKVCCYAAESGRKIAEIVLPASNVSSCCFGGRDLDCLYITTATSPGEEGSGYLYQTKTGYRGRKSYCYQNK